MKSPIEWWPLERFRGRVSTVQAEGEPAVEIPVPDHEIVCDVCNDEVKHFPVPVVMSYALCDACRKKWAIEPGDNEYFETPAYNQGSEPANPRVNYGGRKV